MSKKPTQVHDKLGANDRKRPRLASAPLTTDKRLKIVADLANVGGISKTGLSTVLRSLSEQGLLTQELCASGSAVSYRRQVRDAVEDIPLHAVTPYGPMIRQLELPTTGASNGASPLFLHYVHPLALLSHLASTNADLFNLVKSIAERVNHRLRICIYIDEINPGNPLAPDPQLLLQATYWTILDFPYWLLSRKSSWFCFSLSKSNTIKQVPGYTGCLIKIMLNTFFPASGASFASGCHLTHGSNAVVVTASFAGVLADEKGLKEVYDIKGQGGRLPCPSCLNVRNRFVNVRSNAALQHFWEPDLSKRRYASHEDVKAIVQRLNDASTGTITQLKELETKVGINYAPYGILFDDRLMREVVRFPQHYVRDPMHTLSSNGVAGTHIALMCQALGRIGCGIDLVRMYAHRFTLPLSRHSGKVSALAFKDSLMDTDHVRHFASDVLEMVPLLFAFLVEKIEPKGLLISNIRCFSLLHTILCILRRGIMNADVHARLSAVILEHNSLFLELYGNKHCKPKFHHLFHLPDDLLRAGACISCFVTERKNKDALAVSVATDRTVERSSIISFLHKTISHWSANVVDVKHFYLRGGHELVLNGEPLSRSTSATLTCGTISHGDVVLLSNGNVGRIMEFWQRRSDGSGSVSFFEHSKVGSLFFDLVSRPMIDDVACIVEALNWYKNGKHLVVCLPLH